MDDPWRMYLVIRRGAIDDLALAGELAGAAAVACLERFSEDPEHADAIAAWRERPGKVTLRARSGQWDELLATEPHTLAGDPDGASVLAIPPRRRSERGELLPKLQAMSSPLAPPPAADDAPELAPDPDRLTYLVNPRLDMSSGKTVAQIAHAATAAAARPELRPWVDAGCPGRVVIPSSKLFGSLCGSPGLAAEVIDAGLTEVPPGTVTVLALAPGKGS